MNLLLLSTWFPFPPDNGSRIRAYYLARALAQEHELTIVAFRPEAGGKAGELEQEIERPDWASREKVRIYPVAADPFRFTRLPKLVQFLSPVPLAAWPQRAMTRQVAQLAGERKWDAVVALQLFAAPYARQIARTPRILDLDVSPSYQRFLQRRQAANGLGKLHGWLGWQKTRRFERRLSRHFAACTVVLAAEAAYLREMLAGTPCHVLVSENGVDLERNRPAAVERTANSLIYPGALTYKANRNAVEFFLKRIYPLLKNEQPDVVFAVTGSTEGVDLGRLPLDPSVRLTGYLADPRPAIGRSAVCVIPLRQGTGTRLKILEAMALGVPVVSTSKGAEGLAVVHGQHLLLADEPESFARCTLQLLKDRGQAETLAANARRLVAERYDWNRIGAAFVSLVESMGSASNAKTQGFQPFMEVAGS